MSPAEKRKANRERVRAYRASMRAKGMKLVQIWVPDTSSPEYIAEALRQSRLIAESPFEAEDQAFVDSISEMKFE